MWYARLCISEIELHVKGRAGARAHGISERRWSDSEVHLKRSSLRISEAQLRELCADEHAAQVGFGGALWSGDRGCRSGLRWMACSSALRAEGRPRFTGTKPGPSHGRARSKILPGHDCARLRPHGTALLLAKAGYSVLESIACDSSSRPALGEAAVVPSGLCAVGHVLLGLSTKRQRQRFPS